MKLLAAHAGEPSATLNAGLVGIVDACRDEGEPFEIWGARHGVEGLLSGDWADLSRIAPAPLQSLLRAPGSVIGTSRRGLDPAEAAGLVQELERRGVQALALAGDSAAMAMAANLAAAALERKSDLLVVGLPNSADNAVGCTDHTPGFASAARFSALAVRDLDEDNRSLPASITVVETIGGNTGWIAAAAAVGRAAEDEGPHLIYLPEHKPSLEQIIEQARHTVAEHGRAVIVASEGLRDRNGEPLGALAGRIEAALGIPARAERLGLLGRSCSWALSEIDVEESYRSGRAAAEAMLGGSSGVMIALRRQPGLVYRCFPHAVPFSEAPGRERKLPAEWVGEAGEGADEYYLEWLRPLVGEIPPADRVI